MLASGAALLTALALIQADAQFAAGARFESRAGEAPSFTSTSATQGSQFQVIVSAIPMLSVRMLDENSDLTASSATRIFWRPQPLLERRPLFLETLDVSHLMRPSKRSSWQLNLRTSYGEEDYTVLAQQQPTQPTLPRQLTLFSATGSATGTWRTSRRGALFFQMNAVHRRPLDSQATTGNGAAILFPTETIASAAPGGRYQLTRRTLVELLAAVADTDMSGISLPNPPNGPTPETGIPTPTNSRTGHLNILTVQPQVSISEALTRYQRLRLTVGLTYAHVLRQISTDLEMKPVYPLFQVDLDSLLDRTRGGAVWRSTLSTGTLWYADPMLGVAVWRGFLQGSITSEIGRAWAAGARVAFGTDLTRLPQSASLAGGLVPDQTVLSLDLPVRYRASNRLLAEFGASFAERGSYLDSHFGWRRNSRELWLFLNLNAVTTAARTPPRSQL
jgi:hypothetical protein